MQDQLIREPVTPHPTDDEPGFADCRGQWQSLAEKPEDSRC